MVKGTLNMYGPAYEILVSIMARRKDTLKHERPAQL